eukprot:CAMPEP_0114146900 /NCGR_PEP_ID=MMETSP0043_2-20121206/20810_1 /TAXON_ID=464988 /ORGANISM="Hemiselmis andersenii, Strain CCMP644" /LENGTH=86 /DNA_ID=CAMNT_0001241383 /DNA_START=69 /DNA_END=329 /DNA_ORIENTATION=-
MADTTKAAAAAGMPMSASAACEEDPEASSGDCRNVAFAPAFSRTATAEDAEVSAFRAFQRLHARRTSAGKIRSRFPDEEEGEVRGF